VAKGLAVERLALIAPSPPPAKVISWFAHGFGIGEVLARRMKQTIEGREGIPLEQFEPAWLGARLPQPALVVHDRADRASPLAAGEALAGALPRARLMVTDGLGHRKALNDPHVMEAVARHLWSRQEDFRDAAGAGVRLPAPPPRDAARGFPLG
jgi:pimeloyl-ACP methyl ester carboxylesterase